MKKLNQMPDLLTVQLAKIEQSISKNRFIPVLKNFALLHNEEIVYFQFFFTEMPDELDEKEVDMSALRSWLTEFHPELVKAYTSERGASFYHIMEMEMTKDMQNHFLTYCLINL